MRRHHPQHLIAHVVELVVVGEIARADDLDPGTGQAALGELLGENAGLRAGEIDEGGIGVEVADALQERRKVRIGQRNADRFDDLAAELGEALLECGLRFGARRPFVDQRDDPLAAVLGRPLAHDPGRLRQNETGADEIGRRGGGHRGARDHDDGRDLRLGDERTIGKHGRRDPAGDDVHLVVDDHLLHEAPRVVGHAGIIAQDDFDLLAGDHVAVVLEVKSRAGRGLPTGGGETGAGHGKAHADLDHLLRGRRARAQRDCRGRCERDHELAQSHVVPPVVTPIFGFCLLSSTRCDDRRRASGHRRPSPRSSRRSASGMFLAPGAARSRSRGASPTAR